MSLAFHTVLIICIQCSRCLENLDFRIEAILPEGWIILRDTYHGKQLCIYTSVLGISKDSYVTFKTNADILFRCSTWVCIDQIRVLITEYVNFAKCNQKHFKALNNRNVKMYSFHICYFIPLVSECELMTLLRIKCHEDKSVTI